MKKKVMDWYEILSHILSSQKKKNKHFLFWSWLVC